MPTFTELRRAIEQFLAALPSIDEKPMRQALIKTAGLEQHLAHQLSCEEPPSFFISKLVSLCSSYGTMADGRDPLFAILEAGRTYIGREGQAECDRLLALVPITLRPAPGESPETDPLREAYLRWLVESCGQVLLTGIDPKAASRKSDACLPLSAIYPALLTYSSAGQELMKMGGGERAERRSALSLLNEQKRLVLLGAPGSGKSTFVNFVTLCLAGALVNDTCANLALLTSPLPDDEGNDGETPQNWDHRGLLPVRVILRDFAAEGLPPVGEQATWQHLWNFIAQRLQATSFGDYVKYLQQHLRERGGLILLDGLDEVPEAHRKRVQLKQAVEDFAKMFQPCRMLVTSRTYAYQNQEWRLAGFQRPS